jgi:geranylgeranyl diphosphate synthase type II
LTSGIKEKDCLKIYNSQKSSIDKKLAGLLENSTPETLYEPCDYILKSPGKRIRAFLVLLSAKAAGGNFKDVYNAAAAVEILHNFTLVHDDIMDNASKRRGLTTLHVKYDLNTAILSGDNLIAIAYRSLLKDSNRNTGTVIESFTNSIIEVCEGQSLDKEFEVRKKVSVDNYKLMIQKKTASLVEMCCSLGAQICGGNKQLIRQLQVYGRNLGLAFQIQDDLLDIIGDEKEFGKSVGIDLIEGKKTYLFLMAEQSAGRKDKQLLNKFIADKGIQKKEIKDFREMYERLGVLEETKKEVERYTRLALNSINKINNEEAKMLFNWLAMMLLDRKK